MKDDLIKPLVGRFQELFVPLHVIEKVHHILKSISQSKFEEELSSNNLHTKFSHFLILL